MKLNADVNAAIYFWDEKVGHIISSIAFFAFQIKWLAEINDGLRAIGPRELEELYEEQGMSKIFAAVGPEGTQALAVSKGTRPVTRSGEGTRNEVAICKEFFTDFTDNRSEILIDVKEVDFGYSAANSMNMSKTVVLTNKTTEKVSR